MITASVGVNSSLLLEPAHQLTFWLDAENRHASGEFARATLKLTNISAHKLAVFKVRTNNADMFTVKPVHGVIAPGEAREIVVSVVPASATRLAAIDPKELAVRDSERFLIQSVERAEDMRGFDVSDLVAFWKRVPRELASNSKIGCRFAVLVSGARRATAAPHIVRMDTISKSPQPAVRKELVPLAQQQQQQQAPEESEQDRRLSHVEERGIDRTFDLHDLHRRKSSGAKDTPTPDTYESSSSSESNDNDTNRAAKAPPRNSKTRSPSRALFSILPSDTVEFKVKPGLGPAVLSSATFFLTNKSRAHALAFKVKTTNHEGYYVKPSRGLIGPSNAQPIEILPVGQELLLAVDDTVLLNDLAQREEKDRFMVEIVRVDIASYQELLNLDEKVRKRELVTIWDAAAPDYRDKAMMSCRIVDIPLTKKNLLKHQQEVAPRDRRIKDNNNEDTEHENTWC
ncbi:Motile sperm domain-containing protein 2 [Globisporangium polare]